MSDTDRCDPPPDEDTDPKGHLVRDALPDLERMWRGMSDRQLVLWACRHIYAVGATVEMALEEGRNHGRRLTLLESRVGRLPCAGGDCPADGTKAAE